jgi:hypothetical protein
LAEEVERIALSNIFRRLAVLMGGKWTWLWIMSDGGL